MKLEKLTGQTPRYRANHMLLESRPKAYILKYFTPIMPQPDHTFIDFKYERARCKNKLS